MMKTNDLRELVQSKLKTICNDVYYEVAADDAMYPHIVFNFNSIDLNDLSRDDLMMEVDVWDKSKSAVAVENLADKVDELFRTQNLPRETILPTFFMESRRSVSDPDVLIRHRLLKIQIQNYGR